MKFNIDKKYIEDGLVTERYHEKEPYVIYNYTQACQFSKAWDDITTQCRGLIVHKDTREIIARPFGKFFNYEEHVEKGLPIPDESPKVYDKRDGSLGILYFGEKGDMYIATRGSFDSDQARWATEYIREKSKGINFDQKYTYLFEIIYPENRIVVNYGSYRGLDLLAVIETETGKENDGIVLFSDIGRQVFPISFTSYEDLKSRNIENSEGFVLKYSNGLRLKIKFEDYVKLHKVITGLSRIGIWEMLRDGKDIVDIIKDIPDEMHEWVKEVMTDLLSQFVTIERIANQAEIDVENFETRKEQAFLVSKTKYPGITFAMLDGKDYKQLIWRLIRPVGSVTFRKDIDA